MVFTIPVCEHTNPRSRTNPLSPCSQLQMSIGLDNYPRTCYSVSQLNSIQFQVYPMSESIPDVQVDPLPDGLPSKRTVPSSKLSQERIRSLLAERRKQRLSKFVKPQTPTPEMESQDAPDAPCYHFLFSQIETMVSLRLNLWLTGPAGSGKSYTVQQIAEKLNLRYFAPPIGRETTISSLFGYFNANGEYVRTPLREAFENGGVLALEEIDFASSAVGTALNTLLASNLVGFPDGTVTRHPDCVIVACANTYGTGSTQDYIGSTGMNAATLDRFVFVQYPYDEQMEAKIAPVRDWTRLVQATRKRVNELQIRHVISPRASIIGGKLIEAGFPVDDVKKMVLFKGLDSITITRIESNGPTL